MENVKFINEDWSVGEVYVYKNPEGYTWSKTTIITTN